MTQFAAHEFETFDGYLDFDPADYSRLKFGSAIAADKFGRDMANKFYSQHYNLFTKGREVVVIPSAYNMLEIAATLLARSFMRHLNVILVREGCQIVKWTNMHRTITYFSDYAHMTQEERKRMLSGDTFFINKDFIEGKILLFIDDVIITGTHEDKIREFIKTEELDNECMFLYYVKYLGKDPETEAMLNTCGVNDADTFVSLIHEPGHQIIVRTCKFLLNGSRGQLLSVLGRCPAKFVSELYTSCILEEYHKVPRYRDNLALIRKMIDVIV